MANPFLVGGVASPQSIYAGDTTQNHPLGTKGFLDDRVFYYCRQPTSGTSIFRGYLYSVAAQDANFLRKTTTGTAGQFSLVMTGAGAAPAAGAYAEGFIAINTPVNPGSGGAPTGGSGLTYKIRNHDVSATPTFTILDPIAETLAAATATAYPNPYNTPVIGTGSAPAVAFAGVPQLNLVASSSAPQFFWMQTQGLSMVSIEGTPAAGDPLTAATAGATDAGSLITLITTTATKMPPLVAYATSAGTDEEFALCYLVIRG